METRLSTDIQSAIQTLNNRWHKIKGAWLIGGSCGLILHGISLPQPPRDLDLYADEPYLGAMYEALKQASVDELAYSATSIYESTLSHYDIGGVSIELVGGFKVNALGSSYHVEADYLVKNGAEAAQLGEASIHLMPLGHELIFNIMRARPDRYEVIAKHIRANKARHLPPLKAIISRNHISIEVMSQVHSLLGPEL